MTAIDQSTAEKLYKSLEYLHLHPSVWLTDTCHTTVFSKFYQSNTISTTINTGLILIMLLLLMTSSKQ